MSNPADTLPRRDMVVADLSRASTIPSAWYFDESVLDLEYRRVFAMTWQLAGRIDQLRNPGDYLTTSVGREPIIIVRTMSGELEALSNVCRHRAGPVARDCGNRRSFQCGYHGWTYDLDGTLRTTPEFEGVEDFEPTEFRLPKFEVRQWGPLIFVRLAPEGVSFEKTIGDIPSRISHIDMDEFQFVRRKDWFIDCNWKVYVDNYLEGYHIPIVHPSLFRELDYARYEVETDDYFSIQHSPIKRPERFRTTNESNEASYFWIFPNLMLNVYPDNFSTNLILPIGPNRTITIFEWYFRDPGSIEADREIEETVAFSDEIQIEDIEICEAVQKGLRSDTYDRGRYAVRRENGVHHFHRLLEQFLGQDPAAGI